MILTDSSSTKICNNLTGLSDKLKIFRIQPLSQPFTNPNPCMQPVGASRGIVIVQNVTHQPSGATAESPLLRLHKIFHQRREFMQPASWQPLCVLVFCEMQNRDHFMPLGSAEIVLCQLCCRSLRTYACHRWPPVNVLKIAHAYSHCRWVPAADRPSQLPCLPLLLADTVHPSPSPFFAIFSPGAGLFFEPEKRGDPSRALMPVTK